MSRCIPVSFCLYRCILAFIIYIDASYPSMHHTWYDNVIFVSEYASTGSIFGGLFCRLFLVFFLFRFSARRRRNNDDEQRKTLLAPS